jgi:hypothetical protein
MKVEPWIGPEVVDIGSSPGGQVVEDMDLNRIGQQGFRQMRSDKTGPAGDQGAGDGSG